MPRVETRTPNYSSSSGSSRNEQQDHNLVESAPSRSRPSEFEDSARTALRSSYRDSLEDNTTSHRQNGAETILSSRFSGEDDPSHDQDYDPRSILGRRGTETEFYPTERLAPSAAGHYEKHETPLGSFSSRGGYGGQPFIQTRRGDYGNASVGTKYSENAAVLNSASPRRQERIADTMLRASHGESVNLGRYTNEERRAMSQLNAFSQVAEQHPRRTPGSSAFARASLRSIRDGSSTFGEEFGSGDRSHYIPARPGGANQMRNYAQGRYHDEEADYTAGNMSDSESE